MSDKRPAFVPFDKTLYDALLSAPLTHTQLLVALAVVRLTIGHRNRQSGAVIALRYFVERTHLSRTAVRHALAELCRAGLLVKKEPASGRKAATLAVEMDASRWSYLSPGSQRRKRCGNPGAFLTRSVECATDVPQTQAETPVECATDAPHGALQTYHKAPLSALQTYHSEEAVEDCFSESESGASAKAPPLSLADEDQKPTLTVDEGRELVRQHLAGAAAARRKAALKMALSGES